MLTAAAGPACAALPLTLTLTPALTLILTPPTLLSPTGVSQVPLEAGRVRLTTGGYVEIKPVGDGSQSLVTMVLEKARLLQPFSAHFRALRRAGREGFCAA